MLCLHVAYLVFQFIVNVLFQLVTGTCREGITLILLSFLNVPMIIIKGC